MTTAALAATPEDKSSAIAAGVRLLQAESAALSGLAATLGTAFEDSVALIAEATVSTMAPDRGTAAAGNRVVVTGMGKAGIIARKLVATLASTGTPALHVHPGEASHGDLGMIGRGDVVLALSNSGETAELSDLLNYCKRHGNKIVAITADVGSTLAELADVALILPETEEACPMGLAPTTSTTMMLGLGDALAIAVLEQRDFTAADFHVLHPGGALGRKLLRVQDLMHAGDRVPVIGADAPVSEAILVMTEKSLGCVGVVDDGGSLVGIVTDGDLRRHMAVDLLQQRTAEVMTATPQTIAPEALAVEALRQMNGGPTKPITSLFVVDSANKRGSMRPVGIVHIHDCLRAGIA